MKKHSTAKKNQKALKKTKSTIRHMAGKSRLTIGLDLGDHTSRYCILEEAGEVGSEGQMPTTPAGLKSLFGKMASSRVALEVGTHSPWEAVRVSFPKTSKHPGPKQFHSLDQSHVALFPIVGFFHTDDLLILY